jgi:hypothetical protein
MISIIAKNEMELGNFGAYFNLRVRYYTTKYFLEVLQPHADTKLAPNVPVDGVRECRYPRRPLGGREHFGHLKVIPGAWST